MKLPTPMYNSKYYSQFYTPIKRGKIKSKSKESKQICTNKIEIDSYLDEAINLN